MRASRVALAVAAIGLAVLPAALTAPSTAAVPALASIVFEGDSLTGLPGPAEGFGPPSIHDNGQVAFVAREGSTCGLYQGDGSGSPWT